MKCYLKEDSITTQYILNKTVNLKLKLLNSHIPFNESNSIFEFLSNLNKFLFGDLYEITNPYRLIHDNEKKEIIRIFNRINEAALKKDLYHIKLYFSMIWEKQLFLIGNTRTLLGYFIILNDAYDLNLNIDLDLNIESDYNFIENVLKREKTI